MDRLGSICLYPYIKEQAVQDIFNITTFYNGWCFPNNITLVIYFATIMHCITSSILISIVISFSTPKKAKYVTIFYLLFESFIKNFALNPVYIFITTIGIYYFFFTKKFIKNKICQLNLLISFIFMYLGVYFSGVWYDYYALIIAGIYYIWYYCFV